MMRMKILTPIVACLVALGTAPAAGAQPSLVNDATDSAAVVRVVEQFHAALGAGDSTRAIALLDSAAMVLEGGDLETRSDYLRHHLPADIAFARAVRGERTVRRVTLSGDAAWIVSTSRASGTFNERPVDSEGVELVVLKRTAAGWRIAAIHWSSRRRSR